MEEERSCQRHVQINIKVVQGKGGREGARGAEREGGREGQRR